MGRQIAARVPDDLVDFVDQLVAEGRANSRASVVARAPDRERRREIAARDAAVLARAGGYPDLEGLAVYAVRLPMDID